MSEQVSSAILTDPLTNPPTEVKNQAVLFLLLGILFGVLSAILGYATSADKPWLRRQMTEFLNFEITMTIIFLFACLLNMTIILAIIGIPLLIIAGFGNLIALILATIRTSRGEFYKFPMTLRLLS